MTEGTVLFIVRMDFSSVSFGKWGRMVTLTRLNDTHVVVNADHIEFVEALPDTIVTLTTGQKFMVRESVDEVVERVTDYKRSIHTALSPKRG